VVLEAVELLCTLFSGPHYSHHQQTSRKLEDRVQYLLVSRSTRVHQQIVALLHNPTTNASKKEPIFCATTMVAFYASYFLAKSFLALQKVNHNDTPTQLSFDA